MVLSRCRFLGTWTIREWKGLFEKAFCRSRFNLELHIMAGPENLYQPEPTFLSVPNMELYIEFIGTLQNSVFWLVQEYYLFAHAHAMCDV